MTVSFTTLALNIFNLSTNSEDNNTKFIRLFIDSKALTEDFCQLKILQQLDISVKLNKMTAELANVIFEIRNTIFIQSVNLDILIKLITFLIVFVNTPFLLCLANIDNLGAFFNIITNKVI